jgi:hypothetical protein
MSEITVSVAGPVRRKFFNTQHQRKIKNQLVVAYNSEYFFNLNRENDEGENNQRGDVWQQITMDLKRAQIITSDYLYFLLNYYQINLADEEQQQQFFQLLKKYPNLAIAIIYDLFGDAQLTENNSAKYSVKLEVTNNRANEIDNKRQVVINSFNQDYNFIETLLDQCKKDANQLAPSSLFDLANKNKEIERSPHKIYSLLSSSGDLQAKMLQQKNIDLEMLKGWLHAADESSLLASTSFVLLYAKQNSMPNFELYENLSQKMQAASAKKRRPLLRIIKQYHTDLVSMSEALIESEEEIEAKRTKLTALNSLLLETSTYKKITADSQKLFSLLPDLIKNEQAETVQYQTKNLNQLKIIAGAIANITVGKPHLKNFLFDEYLNKDVAVPDNLAYLIISDKKLWDQCYGKRWWHFGKWKREFEARKEKLRNAHSLFAEKINNPRFNVQTMLIEVAPVVILNDLAEAEDVAPPVPDDLAAPSPIAQQVHPIQPAVVPLASRVQPPIPVSLQPITDTPPGTPQPTISTPIEEESPQPVPRLVPQLVTDTPPESPSVAPQEGEKEEDLLVIGRDNMNPFDQVLHQSEAVNREIVRNTMTECYVNYSLGQGGRDPIPAVSTPEDTPTPTYKSPVFRSGIKNPSVVRTLDYGISEKEKPSSDDHFVAEALLPEQEEMGGVSNSAVESRL